MDSTEDLTLQLVVGCQAANATSHTWSQLLAMSVAAICSLFTARQVASTPCEQREDNVVACYDASVTLVQDRSSKLHKCKFTTASSVDRRLFSRDILAGRSHVPSVKSRCWCPHHRTDQSNEICNHRKVQMHFQVTREIVDWLVRPAYLAGCSWISK